MKTVADEAKPVDLISIRGEAAYLASRDMPVTAATMCAMADEIERLRVGLTESLDGWKYAAQHKPGNLSAKHGDAESIARLRRL